MGRALHDRAVLDTHTTFFLFTLLFPLSKGFIFRGQDIPVYGAVESQTWRHSSESLPRFRKDLERECANQEESSASLKFTIL